MATAEMVEGEGGGGGLKPTHMTQDRTRHPGYPAVQLRLTCDQNRIGSVSKHVKYFAKEKREMEIIGTISTIISKQPALDFRHNLCIVAHTISKS